MTRSWAFPLFLGLATLLHLGAWISFTEPGSEAAGAGGEMTVSLVAASAALSARVEALDASVEPAAAPDALDDSLDVPDDSAVVADKSPDAPPAVKPPSSVAPLEQPSPTTTIDTRSDPKAKPPIAPIDLPQLPEDRSLPAPVGSPDTTTQMSELAPQPLETAEPEPTPKLNTTPAAKPKPAEPPRQKRASKPAKLKTQPKPKPQQKRPATTSQTAAGNQSGENAGAASTQRPSTLSKSAQQTLLAQWGASIRNRVERQKRAPRGVRAKGTTVLRLTVSKAGRLTRVAVIRSSGSAALDKAAIGAVKRARYPAAPKGLVKPQYNFNLPLAFLGK
ncbi:MAG: TonB family protein [Pseudomonadota bacterium]